MKTLHLILQAYSCPPTVSSLLHYCTTYGTESPIVWKWKDRLPESLHKWQKIASMTRRELNKPKIQTSNLTINTALSSWPISLIQQLIFPSYLLCPSAVVHFLRIHCLHHFFILYFFSSHSRFVSPLIAWLNISAKGTWRGCSFPMTENNRISNSRCWCSRKTISQWDANDFYETDKDSWRVSNLHSSKLLFQGVCVWKSSSVGEVSAPFTDKKQHFLTPSCWPVVLQIFEMLLSHTNICSGSKTHIQADRSTSASRLNLPLICEKREVPSYEPDSKQKS